MPINIDGGVPPRWAERNLLRPENKLERRAPIADCVRVAFFNNMPDSALEDTEMQFFELLDAASGETPVIVSLHSLSGVIRGERGQQHLKNFYSGAEVLFNRPVDALIMTGTEPKQPDLRSEPYWASLTNVLDWAESNTSSAILSCLAAHAGVLHSDGILRHPLPDKQFGVFDFKKAASHALTAGTGEIVRFPHSRWNEVRAHELAACGYTVLSESSEGGVDAFAKKKDRSLFVHFQGHPEYGTRTLLKEYRRDIKRYLNAECETYPSMPKGYFDQSAETALGEFRDSVVDKRGETLLKSFPEAAVSDGLRNVWQASAVTLYRNWLQYVVSRKAETTAFPAMAAVLQQNPRKRSAVR